MSHAPLPHYMLLDGGLSTLLVDEFGLKQINDDPLWGSRLIQTNSEVIKKAHTKFLEAGCDIIESLTYQASIDGFIQHLGLSSVQAAEMMQKGVLLACEARDEFWQNQQQEGARQQRQQRRRRPLVAASIGPYGSFLCDGSEYSGLYVNNMTEEELMAWHKKQVSALAGSGADLIAFDTIPALKEATAIATLLTKHFPHMRAWISFACKDGQHLCSGESFAEAAEALLPFKPIVAFGINCTAPEHVTSLVKSLSVQVKEEMLLLVYPNSGESWTAEKRWHESCGEERASLASYVREWMDEGVSWIGGCCRVGPSQLADTNAEMKKYCDMG